LFLGQSQVGTKDRFDSIDLNADGQLDLDEAYDYLKVERENKVPRWFVFGVLCVDVFNFRFIEMDKNGDSFVSPNEFDRDLA
jgi:hypothetical protein